MVAMLKSFLQSEEMQCKDDHSTRTLVMMLIKMNPIQYVRYEIARRVGICASSVRESSNSQYVKGGCAVKIRNSVCV